MQKPRGKVLPGREVNKCSQPRRSRHPQRELWGSVGRSSNSTEHDTEVSYTTVKILATIHKEEAILIF